MTPLSPLQLKQHYFTLLSIRANPKGSDDGKPLLEPEIAFEKSIEGSNEWKLILRVVLKSANLEDHFLYDAEIEIQGVVKVHESYPPEKREQLAVVNGLGLLYSAIREMVLNVTARSAHGALCLPAFNFVEILSKHPSWLKPEITQKSGSDQPPKARSE